MFRPKKNNCLVVLHNFFWEGAGGGGFFYFPNQSQSYTELYPLYLPIKVQISLLYKKYTSLKPVLKCKQVENNNFKNIFKRSKLSKKNKTFLEFWKLGAIYFCTVKTFFQFSKIRGGQPNNFFFQPYLSPGHLSHNSLWAFKACQEI